ncbi:MAG: Lipid A core-O-antigen ligase-like enyme [Comamonadaceae bacterium]|nr:MAG: Lipid A core-O-antigen ligase-like enyme [Comamonadaceae bacterium]
MADAYSEVKPWAANLIIALLFTTCLFALLPPGLSWSSLDAGAGEEGSAYVSGSLGFQLQWSSVFLVSGFIVWHHRLLAWSNFRSVNPFILAMLIYCALGIMWSPVPIVTLKKVVQFAGLIVFSLAVQSDQRPWTHHVFVIAMALAFIELVSAFVSIFIPSFGIDAEFGYAWRGIVSGKNALGRIGAWSALFWVALGRVNAVPRSLYWSGLLLSLLSVVMSKSSTSLTITVLGLISFWIFQKQHIGSPLWLQRLLVIAGLMIVMMLHLFFIYEGRLPERSEILEPFANLFGKSADLTGRADIWAPLYIEIEKHWLLGVGYGAFWLGPGSASQPILDALPWIPYQGHNGYLDVLNELGVIGIFLFLCAVISYIVNLIRCLRMDRQLVALLGSLLLIFLISNWTESTAFRGVTFDFILFIFSCISLSSFQNQKYSNGGLS